MPTSPSLMQAVQSLEKTVEDALNASDSALRLQPSLRERLDAEWKVIALAMRSFLQSAAPHAGILRHSVSRDNSEISVMMKDSSSRTGTSYVVLSRKHPMDPNAPLDNVWLCVVGSETAGYADARDAMRELIKRIIASAG